MIYFTADLHFGHDKPFLYEPRGFNSIQEHDQGIIENWNNIISNDDQVIILGDLMLNDVAHGIECLNRLNGQKKFICGNHDTNAKIKLYQNINIAYMGYADVINYKKYRFYISHYPTICANYDKDKSLHQQTICLCGHSHTKDKFADMNKGLIYHCELDAHNCYPISIDKIIEDLKNYTNQGK